jgi:hypothetical protein
MRGTVLGFLLLLTGAAAAWSDDAATIPYAGTPAEFCLAVRQVLVDGGYDRLEATAKQARDLTHRFPGGQTELEVFYNGLGDRDCAWGSSCGTDETFDARKQHLQEWLDRKSDPTTATVGLIRFWFEAAWAGRGCGFANQVTRDQWKLFTERLNIAAGYARQIDPDADPEVGYLLLLMARDFNLPRAQLDAVFNGARRRFPTFFSYYREYASMMLPKWSGRPEALPGYVRSLLRDPGGEAGEVAYAIVADRLVREMETAQIHAGQSGLDWDTVRRAYATRDRLYGTGPRQWTALCYLATLAGDRDAAREAFRHVAGQLEYWPQQGRGYFYLQILPWIMARDDGPGDGVRTR